MDGWGVAEKSCAASPQPATARTEGTLNDCQLAPTTRERGCSAGYPSDVNLFNEVKVYLPM